MASSRSFRVEPGEHTVTVYLARSARTDPIASKTVSGRIALQEHETVRLVCSRTNETNKQAHNFIAARRLFLVALVSGAALAAALGWLLCPVLRRGGRVFDTWPRCERALAIPVLLAGPLAVPDGGVWLHRLGSDHSHGHGPASVSVGKKSRVSHIAALLSRSPADHCHRQFGPPRSVCRRRYATTPQSSRFSYLKVRERIPEGTDQSSCAGSRADRDRRPMSDLECGSFASALIALKSGSELPHSNRGASPAAQPPPRGGIDLQRVDRSIRMKASGEHRRGRSEVRAAHAPGRPWFGGLQ